MQGLSDTPTLAATLRALAGRWGIADPVATAHFPLHDDRSLAEVSADWETGSREASDSELQDAAPEACRRAAVEAQRLDLLRANAHAAYDSVQGSHRAALDLALSIHEAEIRELRARCGAQAEMLKTIRLYAQDRETRALATRGLDCCAQVLAACQLAEAGCPRDSTYHS